MSQSESASRSGSEESTETSKSIFDIANETTRSYIRVQSPTSQAWYWLTFVWDPPSQTGTFQSFPDTLMTPNLDAISPRFYQTGRFPPDGILVADIKHRLHLAEVIVRDDSPPSSDLLGKLKARDQADPPPIPHQSSTHSLQTIDFPRGGIHSPCRLPNGPIPINDHHHLVTEPITIEQLGALQPSPPESVGSFHSSQMSDNGSIPFDERTPSTRSRYTMQPLRQETVDTQKTLVVYEGSAASASGTSQATDQLLPQMVYLESLIVDQETMDLDHKMAAIQSRFGGRQMVSEEVVGRFGEQAFVRSPRRLDTKAEAARRE